MPNSLAALAGLLLTAALMAGCGGSDDNGYAQAATAAEAQTLEARRLGVKSPCTSAAQCGLLPMHGWTGNCPTYFYEPYSLVSPTAAAASAAAAAQIPLALKAAALSPEAGGACAAVLPTPVAPQCAASTCSGGS